MSTVEEEHLVEGDASASLHVQTLRQLAWPHARGSGTQNADLQRFEVLGFVRRVDLPAARQPKSG